ncbi:MAG: hypothetical protein ACRD16_04245 [Thermoanaerobaculia bacterium]
MVKPRSAAISLLEPNIGLQRTSARGLAAEAASLGRSWQSVRGISVPAAIAAVLLASLAIAQTLPPKEGYSWKRVPEIKAAFLVPNGWHFRREQKGTSLGYFISREKISPPGEFLVGLSINVIHPPSSTKSSEYAKAFINQFASGKAVIRTWDASQGPFVGYGCRVKDDSTTMHALMLANPKTNTLYFVMFEAPNPEWQEAWHIGETLVDTLYLDDDV